MYKLTGLNKAHRLIDDVPYLTHTPVYVPSPFHTSVKLVSYLSPGKCGVFMHNMTITIYCLNYYIPKSMIFGKKYDTFK